VGSGNRIRKFHDSYSNEVAALLADPPRFRDYGFDLSTLDTPHLVHGDCLEVRNGDRKVIQLYQDGTFILKCAADATFLGWGVKDAQWPKNPRLNPVPVVEINASFVVAYAKLLAYLVQPPGFVLFRLELRNAIVNNERLYLTQHYAGGIQNVFRPRRWEVQQENSEKRLTVSAHLVTDSPQRVAGQIVEAFAGFFDMVGDDIPFSKMEDGFRVVDIDALKAVR
jgi:hypothetical protein